MYLIIAKNNNRNVGTNSRHLKYFYYTATHNAEIGISIGIRSVAAEVDQDKWCPAES